MQTFYKTVYWVGAKMDEPNEVSLGPKGWIQYRENPRGILLCRYFWPAENATGVIIGVHGHGAHMCFDFLEYTTTPGVHRYEGSFVEQANKSGLSVCGVDFQGHGRSSSLNGTRCYVSRFQDYVDDVLQFAEDIKTSKDLAGFSGLSIVLLGESLGGCIAVNAIHQKGALFEGAVLLAPMLSLEKVTQQGLNRYLRPFASLLSAVTPYMCVAKLARNEKFPDIQDAFDNDPLCFHNDTRARVGTEYLRATERTLAEMPNMSFPFLVVHSKEDDMTDFEGSKRLVELSKATDKNLEEANEMWHFLLKEPGHERITKLALDWVLQHM